MLTCSLSMTPGSQLPATLTVTLALLSVFTPVTWLRVGVALTEAAITVTPPTAVVELGHDVTFTCTHDNATAVNVWTIDATTDNINNDTNNDNNNTTNNNSTQQALPPNLSDPSGRVTSVNGTLTIRNVSFSDSGQYSCWAGTPAAADDDDPSTPEALVVLEGPQSVTLTVYEMPDYVEEGLIVAGMCAVLLVALVVGIVVSMRREKRKLGGQKRKAEDKRRILEQASKN